MTQIPIDEWYELTVKIPRGHEGIWQIIRSLDDKNEDITIPTIDSLSNMIRRSVSDYVSRLYKAGYLQRISEGSSCPSKPAIYKLIKKPFAAPRLRRDGSLATNQGQSRDQMWRAIKTLKAFSYQDIMAAGSTDECVMKAHSVKSYLRHLKKAGYLIVRQEAKPRVPAIYSLKHSMRGVLAPKIMRTKFVFDPNKNEVFPKTTESLEARS